MVDRIVVFKGSKKDFNSLLDERIGNEEDTIPFMDLIQHYNARLRPNESGVRESSLNRKIEVDNCVVKADDYGSVLEHVLSNFVNIVTLNHDIGCLYVHNPPMRVEESLTSYYDDIEFLDSEYVELTKSVLKKIYNDLCLNILGQNQCKKKIISGLYRLIKNKTGKPVVLMLFGPSGVGKTETAKRISNVLGGDLLRIQFSMMQNEEAYNYVFGSEHSRVCLARDLLGRESNVVLIDEFDKVNSVFYNAFYELFDEGVYVDANYKVELGEAIFLCTCNFMTEEEIKKNLGMAMFSRIGCCIEYDELLSEEKKIIVNNWYGEIIDKLDSVEKAIVDETHIKDWFKQNVDRYDNIRLLKTKMENAIFDELTEKLLFSEVLDNERNVKTESIEDSDFM